MKNIYLSGIILLSFLLFLSSCQQRLYFPDRANTPGLTEVLEGKATFSIKPQGNDNIDSGSADNVNFGASVDLAFSPVQHLGLIASYRWINNRTIDEGKSINFFDNGKTVGGVFNGQRYEIGAGFYDVFGKMGKVEVYGGYGNGSLQRRGTELPQYDYDTRYHRFFIQPAVGFGKPKFFSFTAGVRFAFMKFYDFQSPNPDLRYSIGKNQQDVTSVIFPFIEPFVNVEGGFKYIKGNIQVGGTKQLINTNIAGNFPVFVSIGMVFHFSPDFFNNAGSRSPQSTTE